jgi:hypothetical protein
MKKSSVAKERMKKTGRRTIRINNHGKPERHENEGKCDAGRESV